MRVLETRQSGTTLRHSSPSPSSRTWLRRLVGGGHQIEMCPAWCTDHHRRDDYGYREDLEHGTFTEGAMLPVFNREGPGTVDMPVFAARLNVEPYSDDPARRLPHVNLEPWPDEVMERLGPDELARVITQLRGQADVLESVHARLVAARAEHGS